jgi:hypothetical protein
MERRESRVSPPGNYVERKREREKSGIERSLRIVPSLRAIILITDFGNRKKGNQPILTLTPWLIELDRFSSSSTDLKFLYAT